MVAGTSDLRGGKDKCRVAGGSTSFQQGVKSAFGEHVDFVYDKKIYHAPPETSDLTCSISSLTLSTPVFDARRFQ